MWVEYNANPNASRVGDCVVRAISKATNQSWEDTYIQICDEGLQLYDMPSANHVWGAYLERMGFTRKMVPEFCNVRCFCRNHPKGSYVLAISGHVVSCVDGDYYDTWDSGDEIPIYYWEKER